MMTVFMDHWLRALALMLVAMPAFAAENLTGSRWLVEDIGGAGVVDRAQTTLLILPEGRIAGSGGCNRFTGSGALADGRVTVGRLASTRMACPPAVMNQEARFLAALASAAHYEIRRDGLMALRDGKGTLVMRLSRM